MKNIRFIIGIVLIVFSIVGFVLTFKEALRAEIDYRYRIVAKKHFIIPEATPEANLLEKNESYLPLIPISTESGIVIPKIGANAFLIRDIDPENEEIYTQALQQGVAHAKGTVLPGQIGNSFLFAHSVTNFWEVNSWNAVFYLLKELVPGDEIDIFVDGKRYIYRVYGSEIVDENNVEALNEKVDFAKLTLQTCWPPGTTLKRLLVFARLTK